MSDGWTYVATTFNQRAFCFFKLCDLAEARKSPDEYIARDNQHLSSEMIFIRGELPMLRRGAQALVPPPPMRRVPTSGGQWIGDSPESPMAAVVAGAESPQQCSQPEPPRDGVEPAPEPTAPLVQVIHLRAEPPHVADTVHASAVVQHSSPQQSCTLTQSPLAGAESLSATLSTSLPPPPISAQRDTQTTPPVLMTAAESLATPTREESPRATRMPAAESPSMRPTEVWTVWTGTCSNHSECILTLHWKNKWTLHWKNNVTKGPGWA